MATNDAAGEEALRASAIERLRRRRVFLGHLIAYVLVNALLVVIWAAGTKGFFWPIFVIAGWGILLALNAWKVFSGDDEDRIRHEMDRIRRKA